MRTTITLLLLFFLALTLAPAASADAPADSPVNSLEMKDTIYGTITDPGGSLTAWLFAPAGTKLKLKVVQDKKKGPGVTLELRDPSDAVVPLEKGKAILASTGNHRITMTAAAGRTGEFTVTVKGTPETKAKFAEVVADGVETEFTFSVMADTMLKYKVDKADAVRLTYASDPGIYDQVLFERKKKGILLRVAGDYVFRLRGSGKKAKVTLGFAFEKIRKREVWISKDGFGTAPEITLLDPEDVLSGSSLTEIAVEGGPFEAAVEARLEKDKETIPCTAQWESEDRILVSMNLVGAAKGKWKLVVENPSGAWTSAKLNVIKPGSILLPDGIQDGTEIWYLDFNESFAQDLYEFGLARSVASGGSAAVNRHVERVVKAYVLYWLRHYFGLHGQSGILELGDVPISFIISEVPTVAGVAGVDYNRIEIGGTASAGSDSDNPNLSWGRVAVDPGNVEIDDISDGGPGQATAKLPLFELRPTNTDQTSGPYRDVFAPLLADPVADTDAGLFSTNPAFFLNLDDNNILRYKLIVPAIEVLSKEIAAIAAHHVARAMGLDNGTEGLMDTPSLFGEFATTEDLGFTDSELSDLFDAANPILLPGKSGTLRMKPFQGNPGQPSVIDVLGGLVNQERSFLPTGGRPEKKDSDLTYQVFYNTTAPAGVIWPKPGLMRASPPVKVNGLFYTDAVLMKVVIRDAGDGHALISSWTHRVNVLIDTSDLTLTAQEIAAGLLQNRLTREGPAR